jgi:phage tail sheath protein FI
MALQNLLYPNIQFEEINDSPRPVSLGSTARIGIVGTFRKGPNGVFKLRGSYDEFASMYSATIHLGSVATQAAFDQGATDFGLIRVMGSAKEAIGSVTFTVANPSLVTNGIIWFDFDEYNTSNVLQNTYAVAVNVTALSTATQIATAAATAINTDIDVTALIDATSALGVVSFSAATAGAAANFYRYSLRLDSSTPPAGVVVTPTNTGTQATGQVTVSAGVLTGESFTITLDGTPFTYVALGGDDETDVADALATLIDADADYISTNTLGVVDITYVTYGIVGNSITLAANTDSVGATITPSAATLLGGTQHANVNMTGGADGPVRSSIILQDSTITPADLIVVSAASEGLWGDNIQIETSPGSAAGLWNIVAVDTETEETESYFDLSLAAANLDTNDELIATKNSNLIRITFVGSNNSLTPEEVSSLNLAGGSEGPAILDQDFIDMLDLMATKNVNIVLAAGQTSANIRAALLQQAETADAIAGYRIAVLNADKNMDIAQLATVTQPYNTNTGSGVMVAGWVTYAGQSTLARFGASPDGFYAGHLAVTGVQVSPAARSSSPFLTNVVEVDTVTTSQAFNEYTKARMEALILDPATGGFHCLNGRTLSSDGAWYWVSVRRVYNQIKTDLFRMVQWVKSQPNTSVLRNQFAQQLDTYMGLLLSRGIIANTKASQVDSTNNPPDRVASGFLRAEVFFTPVFPADYVVIGIRRFLSADVTTSVGG